MHSVNVAAALLCLPLMIACGSNASRSAPTGKVNGEFVTLGGPEGPAGTGRPTGPPDSPNDGTITLTDTTSGVTFNGVSGTDGTFSIVVPAGTYKASGRTPRIMGPDGPSTCDSSTPVTVTAGKTATVTIECIVP